MQAQSKAETKLFQNGSLVVPNLSCSRFQMGLLKVLMAHYSVRFRRIFPVVIR